MRHWPSELSLHQLHLQLGDLLLLCLDHRDQLLSKQERAANKSMMVCVSGCKSERLVLDL